MPWPSRLREARGPARRHSPVLDFCRRAGLHELGVVLQLNAFRSRRVGVTAEEGRQRAKLGPRLAADCRAFELEETIPRQRDVARLGRDEGPEIRWDILADGSADVVFGLTPEELGEVHTALVAERFEGRRPLSLPPLGVERGERSGHDLLAEEPAPVSLCRLMIREESKDFSLGHRV